MNAIQQFEKICLLPELDIEEGGRGVDFEYIDFTRETENITASGRYQYRSNDLEFWVTYEDEAGTICVEHVREDGVEYISATGDNELIPQVHIKDGIQHKVVFETHPAAKEQRSITLTLIPELKFFELLTENICTAS